MNKPKALLICAMTGLAMLATRSHAHDSWDNGEPVPVWVKDACCGKADAHHLTADQVHVVDGGYLVDGYPGIIPERSALPSPDGSYWIFYAIHADGTFSPVYCFFSPLNGV